MLSSLAFDDHRVKEKNSDSIIKSTWTQILQLQQYQQKPVKSNKQLFRNAFIHSGGLPVVLHILIAILVDSNCIIDSTALAVALHIIHFLLTSSGGAVLGAGGKQAATGR